MRKESSKPTLRKNIDRCLYCVHFQALGCGGSVRFCIRQDAFLTHDPSLNEDCPYRESVEGAD